MGLDTVELLISFEEAFDIEVSDGVAVTLETPRKVIDYVYNQQAVQAPVGCLTARAFNRLRKAFVDEGVCDRQTFRPDSILSQMLPIEKRRGLWKKLRDERGLTMPRLSRSPGLVKVLLIATLVISIALGAFIAESLKSAVFLAAVFSIMMGLLFEMLTRPLATYFPVGLDTASSLARYITDHSPKSLTQPQEILSRSQIASTVKAITLEYCDPKDYHENAHFVQDMGLD